MARLIKKIKELITLDYHCYLSLEEAKRLQKVELFEILKRGAK